ncbi:zinc-finger domain-containing protein [Paenalcaligenes hominis]|uniref:zinc-finger domain-containing protein n=1 Tax=Paenalcaligenes hominis TaxID=643674 RepID=UPI0035264EA8
MSAVPNAQQQSETHFVTEADLPVYCPPPNAPLWNMHPRVYIEIEKEGRASCPYCSATYQLVPENHPE